MSALGKNVAIVSVGMACQTGIQIRRNLAVLSDLVGDRLEDSSFPFDWLIMPPEPLCRVIRSRDFFPASPRDLQPRPDVYPSAVHWRTHGLYFWHDFLGRKQRTDIGGTFSSVAKKYAYLSQKFLGLRGRRIFVLSNTQNNLDWVGEATNLDFTLHRDRVEAVRTAIDDLFPTGTNELLVVSYRNRTSDDPTQWPAYSHIIEPDDSEFAGSDQEWATVFREYFRAGRGTAAA